MSLSHYISFKFIYRRDAVRILHATPHYSQRQHTLRYIVITNSFIVDFIASAYASPSQQCATASQLYKQHRVRGLYNSTRILLSFHISVQAPAIILVAGLMTRIAREAAHAGMLAAIPVTYRSYYLRASNKVFGHWCRLTIVLYFRQFRPTWQYTGLSNVAILFIGASRFTFRILLDSVYDADAFSYEIPYALPFIHARIPTWFLHITQEVATIPVDYRILIHESSRTASLYFAMPLLIYADAGLARSKHFARRLAD